MIVIVGLVVLLVAVIVGLTGVLTNAGPTHLLTENFSVLGYHVTGSTGTLFLFGIVIGAVAMLGLSVLLAGAQRTAGRGPRARRPTRTRKFPTRNGVAEPRPRPTARTPAARRSHRLTGEPAGGRHPPRQGSPARSLAPTRTTHADSPH
jgi:hypothetical protein